MNELVEYAQNIMAFLQQNGASLNIESQTALGAFLKNILEIIQESQGTPNEISINSDITQAMPSSNVEGFAYDDKSGRMLVRFLGKYPNRNGPIYAYEGVPLNIFEIFRNGAIPAKTNGRNKWGQWWQGKYPSMGAAMYHVIRAGGYPYQRVA